MGAIIPATRTHASATLATSWQHRQQLRKPTAVLVTRGNHRELAWPFDVQLGIIPPQHDFIRGAIKLIALIIEFSYFRQNEEAVSETTGYPKLATIPFTEFNLYVSSIGRTADSHINRDVEHAPMQDRHKLSLGFGILKVQASKNAFRRPRQVVLHESPPDTRGSISGTLK